MFKTCAEPFWIYKMIWILDVFYFLPKSSGVGVLAGKSSSPGIETFCSSVVVTGSAVYDGKSSSTRWSASATTVPDFSSLLFVTFGSS